ncbi:uncharacterized protein LOC125759110 [Rhipicephalus sanguineus]|uniref:uncharacterized protein LOC125759110 n=1 Tax=Rhipicephalus sanguineus TaxID=34632 RepID=UPI0020C22578|nr:uncharacterized protein LOC125759110 [Rhipicephalus sanguineus]
MGSRPPAFDDAGRAQVSAEIDRLVEVGVLSPVSLAEWATPVVPVAKKNGDIRLRGDFKLTVNPATRTEQYPLPKIEDIFATLAGGEVFSTLDLRNAYNQLPLDDDAKKIAVLNTHKGLFCYNRLAFAIASAPALFQRRIEAVLQGLPGVKVYLDDIIVAEKAQNTTLLHQVLERLRANGLTLNKEKCRFREKEVVFLGHLIDARGLHPLQDNLEAVLAAPPPTSNVSDHTSKDCTLQQVKNWILQGWPKCLGAEEQQYQPYFARRTTPTQEEQSPAERLLGFQPRTRLSNFFAKEKGRRRLAVNGVPSPEKKEYAPGMQVWSRQYGQPGQRWLPGTVTTVEGKRLLTVNTPTGVQRRHLDQVRARASSTPVKEEPFETPVTLEHSSPEGPLSSAGDQTTSSDALHAGQSVPGEPASGGDIEPAVSGPTEPIQVRRSTRARKPLDRF